MNQFNMNYHFRHISGNSYLIRLVPDTDDAIQLLRENNDKKAIENCYYAAAKQHFPAAIHVASFTPGDDFPYSAIVELYEVSGSV